MNGKKRKKAENIKRSLTIAYVLEVKLIREYKRIKGIIKEIL